MKTLLKISFTLTALFGAVAVAEDTTTTTTAAPAPAPIKPPVTYASCPGCFD